MCVYVQVPGFGRKHVLPKDNERELGESLNTKPFSPRPLSFAKGKINFVNFKEALSSAFLGPF
jgi:hypothetical protein